MEKLLRLACIDFEWACRKKLETKEKQGWFGWDNPDNKEKLERYLIEHTEKPLTQRNLIDIANFCNFLWNLIENKKE